MPTEKQQDSERDLKNEKSITPSKADSEGSKPWYKRMGTLIRILPLMLVFAAGAGAAGYGGAHMFSSDSGPAIKTEHSGDIKSPVGPIKPEMPPPPTHIQPMNTYNPANDLHSGTSSGLENASSLGDKLMFGGGIGAAAASSGLIAVEATSKQGGWVGAFKRFFQGIGRLFRGVDDKSEEKEKPKDKEEEKSIDPKEKTEEKKMTKEHEEKPSMEKGKEESNKPPKDGAKSIYEERSDSTSANPSNGNDVRKTPHRSQKSIT